MNYKIKVICFMCCNLLLLLFIGCGKDYNESSVEAQTTANAEVFGIEQTTTEATTFQISTTEKETTTFSNIETTTHTTTETTTIYETTATAVTAQNSITATNMGLYNAQTMECLYSKASANHIYPASLTKILTACTALKYVSPDTVFTVGTEQSLVPKGSSLCLIQPGHRLKLCDLLTGMLMCSGNDAAYTVAVNVAKEVSGNANMSNSEAITYFSELMNSYAHSIGAVNSNFTNPDGWDDENQYSTVYDLAIISSHAIRINEIRSIVSSRSKYVVFESGENITWKNTNALLQPESKYYLPQAIGLKTGTTANAGNCLIAVVNIDSVEYIAVVIGCESDSARYKSAHALINMIE